MTRGTFVRALLGLAILAIPFSYEMVPLTPAVVAAPPNSSKSDGSAAALKPVPIEAGIVSLSPQNTKIVFVGTHKGPKPDPRTGGFEKFTGRAVIDSQAKTLKSVVIDIDTNSIWTEIPKLTDHLKSPDFFEVREYPKAKFEATQIKATEGGQTQVRGKLTLHGVTKEIIVPADIKFHDEGLTVTSNFDFNRSDFGMAWGTDRVDDKVSMTVVVGEKTSPTSARRPINR